MSAFLAALAALPQILKAVMQFVSWAKSAFGPDWPKRITEIGIVYERLERASTEEERRQAARDLSRVWNGR